MEDKATQNTITKPETKTPDNEYNTIDRPLITIKEIGVLTAEELSSPDMPDLLFNSFVTQYLDADESRDKIRIKVEQAVKQRAEQLGLSKRDIGKMLTGVSRRCESRYKEAVKIAKEAEKNLKKHNLQSLNVTHFISPLDNNQSPIYPAYICDGYFVEDGGIWKMDDAAGKGEMISKYPVIIYRILSNKETGKTKFIVAFKRKKKWKELTVSSETVLKASKITDLSSSGLFVSSENAKSLVTFLQDQLTMNEDMIPELISTSKMGWVDQNFSEFIPYTNSSAVFDGQDSYPQYKALKSQKGSYADWLEEIKLQRRLCGNKLLIPMAAALAAPLIKMLGRNSFVVDIYGTTGNAKSVLLMLVASMIGNPDIGSGIVGNFSTTFAGIEIFADFLNNIPLLLDDSNSASSNVEEAFDFLIYNLVDGKGKTRSNKDLGSENDRSWKLTIVTTGERPLTEKCAHAGAIARVLEMSVMDSKIFCKDAEGNHLEDAEANIEAHRLAEFARQNHGWLFPEWINIITAMGKDKILEIYKEKERALKEMCKVTSKQLDSLVAILVADQIVSDNIFCDGIYIDIDDASKLLMNVAEIDDNARAYKYLVEKYAKSPQLFVCSENEYDPFKKANTYNALPRTEQLGVPCVSKPGYVNFFATALKTELAQIGVSKDTFLKWADKQGLLITQPSQKGTTNIATINGVHGVCVHTILIDPETASAFTDSVASDV